MFAKSVENKKGFTLIELLIVLAVMALIATIAFPMFSGLIKSFDYKADSLTANGMARLIQFKVTAKELPVTPTNPIGEADYGEVFPTAKTGGGLWHCSHDGTEIIVLYDLNGNKIIDAGEPFAKKNVVLPID